MASKRQIVVGSLPVGRYTTPPVHDSGGYDIVMVYAATATTRSVRHILIAAPTPYTVSNRPAWFGQALFYALAQLCTAGAIHIYITNVGDNPCAAAAGSASPSPTPSP